MNSGEISKQLGLPGILSEVEDVIIVRDIILAKGINARLHICHISTSLGVDLLKFGKNRCEGNRGSMPPSFTLTDREVLSLDTNFKMNPPLRSEEDVRAIKRGLKRNYRCNSN